jgi:hypothetical protein
MTPSVPLKALAERWSTAKPAERANAQLYIVELCGALGVEPPRPAGSGYEFELPVRLIARDGSESPGFIDCYKAGHFVLEAKDYEEGRSADVLLRKAFGQARMYASHDPAGVAPPYLLVLDVAKTLLIWDRWAGTFGGYAAARRIDLVKLHERPDDAALLVDVWTNPTARNPRLTFQAVTKDIAAHLAELAASLEGRGFEQERVARFLMRCVFTMFSEDVGLLADHPFRRLLDEIAVPTPAEFPGAAEELWRAMDAGRRFGFRKLLRFNGHFFKDAEALPLTREDLTILLEAAKADWAKVEPTIFGTLLTRALDPTERHRLGAEYTPPEFIERLIRPTIEEPVRERWTAVQAEVLQLREAKKPKERAKAEQRLVEFHEWLRSLKVLDPACGSGNFLYLAMHALKRIEVEVLHEIADGRGGALELRMEEVDPSQFYGIEVKPWAREIAELTLWIGFHQFWRQQHGDVQPAEPLLRDTGTLECRDAVLSWDHVRNDEARDRPDPRPRVPHSRTGELVPDPAARRQYAMHVNARPAPWPQADFIVGNPPYLGQFRQREALGDGYVDALRAAYKHVPDSADLVTYWWYRAAEEVAAGRTIRAGLITTNSITQSQNRVVIADAADKGARVTWAIPNHVWYEGGDGAEVRVAMTVIAKDPTSARLVQVEKVEKVTGDVPVVSEVRVPRLNADLTADADIATAVTQPLLASAGVAARGFMVAGAGFILDAAEAEQLRALDTKYWPLVRPFRNGKDLTARSRGSYVIDFGLRSEAEARAFPVVFDIVRDRVKPERDANQDKGRREKWWLFGRTNEDLRKALTGLRRYIATAETSKHRFFTFLDSDVAPDNAVVCIASDDAYVLGVLSSSLHLAWALAAGGRMGVRDTPSYNKGLCFEPFPFPDATDSPRAEIAAAAERIEAHRSSAVAAADDVTLMKLYDVVEALRTERTLTAAQQRIHMLGACGVLKDLHDELDHAVASAYGWSWPEPPELVLERLVMLHDQRRAEEAGGRVRWIRPEFQAPKFGRVGDGEAPRLDLQAGADADVMIAGRAAKPWPGDAVGQITALRQLAGTAPVTVDDAVAHFAGAPRTIVARHLETLAILGEVRQVSGGRYATALAAA